MNRLISIQKWVVLILLLCLASFACTDDIDPQPGDADKKEGLPVTLDLKSENNVPGLKYKVYIFEQPSGGLDYGWLDTLSLSPTDDSVLPFIPTSDALYRFLFVATPTEKPEISIADLNGKEPTSGTKWQDIIISSTNQPLSTENYYGIVQQTGDGILNAGKVNGELKRLVGQMVFLFYKADPEEVKTPIDVDPNRALSVFDRVSSIKATYSKYPYAVTFGTDTMLKPLYRENKNKQPLIQTWEVTLDEQLQAPMPQTANHLETVDGIGGSVKMTGYCFYPCNNQIVVNMKFKYYDTLPICGQTEPHTPECYKENELDLELKPENKTGLSIRNGYFTVNRGAITLDRVIDIHHESELNVTTKWDIK